MAVTAGFGELCSILSALAWAIGLMFYRQLGATLTPLQLNFLKNLLVLAMLPSAQLTVALPVQLPWLAAADTNTAVAGKLSVTVTPLALPGPLFTTVIV